MQLINAVALHSFVKLLFSFMGIVLFSAGLASAGQPGQVAPKTTPQSNTEKLRLWRDEFTNPIFFVRPLPGVTLNQIRNVPKEWGDGAEGFGKRYADSLARLAIYRSSRYALAIALDEDLRYFPSQRRGFWPRLGHALRSTVVVRTDTGQERFAFGTFASAYGTAFLSWSWQPRSTAGVRDALVRGSIVIASEAGWNVFREFFGRRNQRSLKPDKGN